MEIKIIDSEIKKKTNVWREYKNGTVIKFKDNTVAIVSNDVDLSNELSRNGKFLFILHDFEDDFLGTIGDPYMNEADSNEFEVLGIITRKSSLSLEKVE